MIAALDMNALDSTHIVSNHVCTCVHHSPNKRRLRSPEFNKELAAWYVARPGSCEVKIDFVYDELYFHHEGKIFDWHGRLMGVRSTTPELLRALDGMFGEQARHWMKRYLERASLPRRYRLHRRCMFPVMMLHFARVIHECRTIGRCSRRF